MTCVILQPSYIPWRGYFHQVFLADTFIFLDDVQYDRGGWRNRNRIQAARGPLWLTIPVLRKGNVERAIPIREIRIDWSRDWARKHWLSIAQAYARAPFFDEYAPSLESLYRGRPERLADFTIDMTVALAHKLGIEQTRFVRSSDLDARGTKTDRLLDLLQKAGATRYLSGPAASAYLDEGKLSDAGIAVEYMDYDYPEYPQLRSPFDPKLSILDLLFMTGPRAGEFIWGGTSES